MTQDAALTALCALTATLSGVAAVQVAERDPGRPAAAHITVRVVTDTALGWTVIAGTSASQRRRLRAQIDAYGATACTGLLRLASLLQSQDPRVMASGLALQGVNDVSNTTAILATGHEPRRTIEVLAAYDLTLADAQGPTPATAIDLDVDDLPTLTTPLEA